MRNNIGTEDLPGEDWRSTGVVHIAGLSMHRRDRKNVIEAAICSRSPVADC